MSNYAETKARLSPIVKEKAFIKLSEPITLSSGIQSDIYFDGKQITLADPEALALFAACVVDLITDINAVDALGGYSIGADFIVPAVTLTAYQTKKVRLPGFVVRKVAKKHGLQKMVEGAPLRAGMRIVLVEDVVTTGGSVLKAVKEIEAAGCTVTQIICLVDRLQGGTEALTDYNLTPVFTKDELE